MNDQAETPAPAPEWLVELRQQLAPWIDWIPPETRAQFPVEFWAFFLVLACLLVLVLVGYTLRAVYRKLFVWPTRHEWDPGLREDMSRYPAPFGLPEITVYGVRAWVRLAVVAPVGPGIRLQAAEIPELLERLVPGLGEAARRNAAALRIWPRQLATMGFTNSFHRCTPTGEPAGRESRWIFLAGRASAGEVAFFVGLALQTDRPTALGRRNLEIQQWPEVLRCQRGGFC